MPPSPSEIDVYLLNYKLAQLAHLDLAGCIINTEPNASKLGGRSDVYSAWSMKHGRKVAIKRVRIYMKNDMSFARKLVKELRIWAKLDHECVLPLLGYFVEGEGMLPSLVSEWMEKGTIDVFMEKSPRGGVETWDMVWWITSGLAYLHSQGVIHADLKCQNILISPFGKPLLADFGLSVALTYSVTKTKSTFNPGGTTRWMAIELFDPLECSSNSDPSIDIKPKHTEKTDMWAYGMVIYELLSGNVPYPSKHSDWSTIAAIMTGELPSRPSTEKEYAKFSDVLWALCEACWAMPPSSRPTAGDILTLMFGGSDFGVARADAPMQAVSNIQGQQGRFESQQQSFPQQSLHPMFTMPPYPPSHPARTAPYLLPPAPIPPYVQTVQYALPPPPGQGTFLGPVVLRDGRGPRVGTMIRDFLRVMDFA